MEVMIHDIRKKSRHTLITADSSKSNGRVAKICSLLTWD